HEGLAHLAESILAGDGGARSDPGLAPRLDVGDAAVASGEIGIARIEGLERRGVPAVPPYDLGHFEWGCTFGDSHGSRVFLAARPGRRKVAAPSVHRGLLLGLADGAGLDEIEEVPIELVRVGGGQAVRCARVDLEDRVL